MDIHDILHIDRVFIDSIAEMAWGVVNKNTEYSINQNIERLNNVKSNLPEGKLPSREGLDILKTKVINCSINNRINKKEWSLGELRLLTYYIADFSDNDEAYKYVLLLLNEYWRDFFFNGLIFSVMHNWNNLKYNLRDDTCHLIKYRLQLYNGNITKFIKLSEHIDIFDSVGPQRLAYLLLNKQLSVIEASAIIGLKQSSLCESYFSDVIILYCKKLNKLSTGILDSVFRLHNHTRTKQLVFANWVMSASKSNDAYEQQTISKYINDSLGDITYIGTWLPQFEASEEETSLLNEARRLTNLWLTKKVIEVFFEKCVQDPDRRRFWLQYVNSISDFKIVCSSSTKTSLILDERIGNTAQNHFIAMDSNRRNDAALILLINNKILIEFAEKASGAVYAYNTTNRYVGFLYKNIHKIGAISDLKNTSFEMLVSYGQYGGVYYSDEGRLVHIGEWQSRMKSWIEKKLDVKPGQYVSSNGCFSHVCASAVSNSFEMNLFADEPNTISKDRNVESDLRVTKTAQPPITNQPVKTSSSIKDAITDIVYDVKAFGRSKTIFVGSSNEGRVVFSKEGFYFNKICQSNKYFNINTKIKGSSTGCIWIKGDKGTAKWLQIIHNVSGLDRYIGYLSEIGDKIYYKESKDGVPKLITD